MINYIIITKKYPYSADNDVSRTVDLNTMTLIEEPKVEELDDTGDD